MTDKEKEIIKNLEEYLQEEMWKYTGPTLGKEECELFLKLLTQKDERPKGKWVTDSNYPDTVICNKCNSKYDVWWIDKGSNYCPKCGAEMIGEE